MSRIAKTLGLNTEILEKCRKQIGLSLEEVQKKVPKIAEIEKGNRLPTHAQLSKLGSLYAVPAWVFISTELPEQYQYIHAPSFRTISDARASSKIKQLVVRVEEYRDLLLELSEDINNSIGAFDSPDIDLSQSLADIVKQLKQWLGIGVNEVLPLGDIKSKIEQKGVFVFFTSKYAGWSHIEPHELRGLYLTHERMPIIIINDSDAKKAQLFTLVHELGHLLKNNDSFDDSWDDFGSDEEKWCDQLAGSFLMPENEFLRVIDNNYHHVINLDTVKEVAESFLVSPYACLVRLRQTNKITQGSYNNLEKELQAEYDRYKKRLKDSKASLSRNRAREVKTQFGSAFVNTVLTAHNENQITIHKAIKFFGLNDTQVFRSLSREGI